MVSSPFSFFGWQFAENKKCATLLYSAAWEESCRFAQGETTHDLLLLQSSVPAPKHKANWCEVELSRLVLCINMVEKPNSSSAECCRNVLTLGHIFLSVHTAIVSSRTCLPRKKKCHSEHFCCRKRLHTNTALSFSSCSKKNELLGAWTTHIADSEGHLSTVILPKDTFKNQTFNTKLRGSSVL